MTEIRNITDTDMAQIDESLTAEPDTVALARKRTSELVENIAGEARLTLRKSRDELDNLMAQIAASQQALSGYIGEFARFSAEAITTAHSISAAVRKAAEPFASEPRNTITSEPSDD
jgi:type I restriction-modification system DNA methylase subunit